MATAIRNERMIDVDVSSSSDDEYYYEYEMVDDSTAGEDKLQTTTTTTFDNKRVPSTVSVETVEDDEDEDDDEYTYEEETILEVVMEEQPAMEDTDSTAEPPPLPKPRNDGYGSKPPPPTSKPPPLPQATSIPSYVPSSPKEASPVLKRSSYKQSSFLQQQAPPDLQSPSHQRAKNSAGLSELSKQLRILQAKNESQNVDINRLERQLRILADLQGISVGDLRKALEQACASEAFGELQNRVAKLKYELEAATLLKQDKLRKDAAAPYIANLELKVGELEEVEEKQQREIRKLYESLRQEKAKATQYQSENHKLRAALQDMIRTVQTDKLRAQQAEEGFQKQLQELRERQSKMMQEHASMSSRSGASSGNSKSQKGSTANSVVAVVSPEMAKEYEQMVQLLKRKDEELRTANAKLNADEIRKAEHLKNAQERWCEEQMKMQVEKDKMALTVKELEDADGQNGLRLAQFKARFTVQNERIVDMGQQLDSLYTAFDMYKEEFDSERTLNETMQSNLTDADAAIARQKMEEGKSKSSSSRESPGFPPSSPQPSYVTTTSPRHARKPAIATRAPVSPMTPVTARASPTPYYSANMSSSMAQYSPNSKDSGAAYSNYSVDFNNTPTTYATARAYNPTPEKTPSTWDILKNRDTNSSRSSNNNNYRYALPVDNPDGELICGSLIVESKSMLRKWKTRPSRIYLRGEGYQWDIGEKRSFPLEFGISKVEFDPNYPLSFAVSLDPASPNAPTIRAATANEHEYHRWMAALYKATTGEEYQGGVAENSNVVAAAKSHRFEDLERTPDPWATATAKSHRFNDLERTPDPWANATAKSHRFNDLERSPDPWSTVPSASRAEESDTEDADLQRILELSKYET